MFTTSNVAVNRKNKEYSGFVFPEKHLCFILQDTIFVSYTGVMFNLWYNKSALHHNCS